MNYTMRTRTILICCLILSANLFGAPVDLTWPDEVMVFTAITDRVQEAKIRGVNYQYPTVEKAHGRRVASLGSEVEKRKLRVLIDPGHGGKDDGAQGLYRISEKSIALKLSKMVQRELERYSKLNDFALQVELTRADDTFIPLKDRNRIANEWDADLFLSIHLNSSPAPNARGFEVYFMSPTASDAAASKLASIENQGMKVEMKSPVQSILSDVQLNQHVSESSEFAETMFSSISTKVVSNGRAVRQAPFAVLHGTEMPAVLIEIGYVTHFEDAKNLIQDPYLKRLAGAISGGVVEFAKKRALKKQKVGMG